MAPRAYWKGYLKLSLVSCPIQLFPATSEREKIKFHQVNRRTGNRIKYCKIDAVTGEPVDGKDIVKAYEVGKGRYVEITDDELEAAAIGSTHTIEMINSCRGARSTSSIGRFPTISPRRARPAGKPSR
jgi:DNA end-binding protein Ku